MIVEKIWEGISLSITNLFLIFLFLSFIPTVNAYEMYFNSFNCDDGKWSNVRINNFIELDEINLNSLGAETAIWFRLEKSDLNCTVSNADLNFVFDLVVPGYENQVAISEIYLCKGKKGNIKTTDAYFIDNCNYQNDIGALTKIERNEREEVYKIDLSKVKAQEPEGYSLIVKYSIKDFVIEGFEFPFIKTPDKGLLFNSWCDLRHCGDNKDNNIGYNRRMVVLPENTIYDDSTINPVEVSMRPLEKRFVLTFDASKSIYLKYVNSEQRDLQYPLFFAIIGAVMGAIVSLIFKGIKLISKIKWIIKLVEENKFWIKYLLVIGELIIFAFILVLIKVIL